MAPSQRIDTHRKLLVGLLFSVCCSALIGSSHELHAQDRHTLTFDTSDYTSVDGQSLEGLTFHFLRSGSPSAEAYWGSFGPGSLQHVQDPSLTGKSDGTLVVEFAQPTNTFEFGVALSKGEALSDAVLVKLLGADGHTVHEATLNTQASGPLSFSEAKFGYAGESFTRGEIRFRPDVGSFALDNLTYAVPEPASQSLVVGSIIASLVMFRSQRRRST